MNDGDVHQYITKTFPGVETATVGVYTFYFYGAERQLPFATVAAADTEFDRVSNLDRPGVFRLNMGVSRDTYRSLLGPEAPWLGLHGRMESGHDFTALDRILPHPFYAPQSWICVLNPSPETFRTLEPLFAEAYSRAVRRAERRGAPARADPLST